MRSRNLTFITVVITVILVVVFTYLYYFKDSKSDLNTIIAGVSTSTQEPANRVAQSYTSTPTAGTVFTSTPGPTEPPSTNTPAIDTAYYTEETPVSYVQQKNTGSNNVIVYNTHPFEEYESGVGIKDYSMNIVQKLNDFGIFSIFLDNSNEKIEESYITSRRLVEDNVKDYMNCILLDVHRSETYHNTNKDISIWIGKGNKNFEGNKRFAESIINNIILSGTDITCELVVNDTYIWNQDLSDRAVLVVLGAPDTPDARICETMDVFNDAIKKSIGEN